MRLKQFSVFLTFVLALALALGFGRAVWGAPMTSPPPKTLSDRTGSESDDQEYLVKKKEALQISAPPLQSPSRSFDYRNRYNSGRLFVGFGQGRYNDEDATVSLAILGYQRTFTESLGALDWSVSTTGFKYFGGDLGLRVFPRSWSAFYRPYGRVALQAHFVPKDFLANLINIKRYSIRGSVGLHNIADLNDRWGAELAASVGLQSSSFEVVIFFPTPF
jgi:hypothetical protein